MKKLTTLLLSPVATLLLVATAGAWQQERAACERACTDELHRCISNAEAARIACRQSCQPMHTAKQDACDDGANKSPECQQAKADEQACNSRCENQARSDRIACIQNGKMCKAGCQVEPTDTPGPVNTDTPTAPAETP